MTKIIRDMISPSVKRKLRYPSRRLPRSACSPRRVHVSHLVYHTRPSRSARSYDDPSPPLHTVLQASNRFKSGVRSYPCPAHCRGSSTLRARSTRPRPPPPPAPLPHPPPQHARVRPPRACPPLPHELGRTLAHTQGQGASTYPASCIPVVAEWEGACQREGEGRPHRRLDVAR